MHEEWLDTKRTASTEVQLTEAPAVHVTKRATGAVLSWQVEYRIFRVEVSSSWPGAKIGNGHTMVHLHCNEVRWTGELSQQKVTLLLTDLDDVPQWLVDLVRAAEARNFG